MTAELNKLIAILDLDKIKHDLFLGNSIDIGTGRIYGGQVLGQALKAMQMTVDSSKHIHSMHAYFMREGNYKIPVTYQIDISRDGKSFSTRHVTASQNNKPIFVASASFQLDEAGLEYQQSVMYIPGPELLVSIKQLQQQPQGGVDFLHGLQELSAPFEIRPDVERNAIDSPRQYTWFKTTHPVADDQAIHLAILAYLSDYGLITTTLLPHHLNLAEPDLQMASIDHAIWFHRPCKIDEWLLYVCEPVSTGNARGLAKGSIYDIGGRLVSTTVQEGLLRLRKKGN